MPHLRIRLFPVAALKRLAAWVLYQKAPGEICRLCLAGVVYLRLVRADP